MQDIDTRSTQPLALKHIQRNISIANSAKKITEEIAIIDGFIATAVVNVQSGMALATLNANDFDIEEAAIINTEVLKTKFNTLKALNLGDEHISDMLITLTTQYHLIAPSSKNPNIFIYLAIDKDNTNLAMARHYLNKVAESLDI